METLVPHKCDANTRTSAIHTFRTVQLLQKQLRRWGATIERMRSTGMEVCGVVFAVAVKVDCRRHSTKGQSMSVGEDAKFTPENLCKDLHVLEMYLSERISAMSRKLSSSGDLTEFARAAIMGVPSPDSKEGESTDTANSHVVVCTISGREERKPVRDSRRRKQRLDESAETVWTSNVLCSAKCLEVLAAHPLWVTENLSFLDVSWSYSEAIAAPELILHLWKRDAVRLVRDWDPHSDIVQLQTKLLCSLPAAVQKFLDSSLWDMTFLKPKARMLGKKVRICDNESAVDDPAMVRNWLRKIERGIRRVMKDEKMLYSVSERVKVHEVGEVRQPDSASSVALSKCWKMARLIVNLVLTSLKMGGRKAATLKLTVPMPLLALASEDIVPIQ